MASRNSNSLLIIVALFFILFIIFNVRVENNTIIATSTTPYRRIPAKLLARDAAKRAYIDAHTFTPNIDITPFNYRW